MATVPGTPDDDGMVPKGMVGTNIAALPKALQPTMADIIMATAVASQRNPEAFRVAGEVLRFPSPSAAQGLNYLNKSEAEQARSRTREILSRALGGGPSTVLPMTPKEGD
jgi:hypothetical protein